MPYTDRVHRFFTPLLRRLYVFLGVFLAIYYSALALQHSAWNKERLYRKLLSGDREAKLAAVTDLVYLKGEAQLVRALRSPLPVVREIAANSLWDIWFHAAGEEAFHLTQTANQALQRNEHKKALAVLNKVTVKFPGFAEGWNRRATLHWQLGRYRESIADCEKVVALNPDHFGAWQGMGLCQIHLGELRSACESFRAALNIVPHDRRLQWFLHWCEDLLYQISPGSRAAYDTV